MKTKEVFNQKTERISIYHRRKCSEEYSEKYPKVSENSTFNELPWMKSNN